MPGSVRVGRPNRIRHIPLSWDVAKARSNHEPKFRPVGDAILRGRERSVGQVMEEMFAAMPSVEPIIAGEMDVAAYLAGAMEVAEPFRVRIAEILQPTFNEGALMSQDRIRADMNEQLRRVGSPLRLTDADGAVTKATVNPQIVGGVRVGMSPKAEWAAVGVEAFDSVDAASVQYAQFRSGTLVTAMVEEQQRVIQSVIGESFTAQQTFQTGRTVTGLTAQQTSQALVTVLQDVNPTTTVGQNLARFRSVNMNGLTKPWEQAVYHRAERMADALAKQGVTGVKAQMKIQKGAQAHANKLRRSRARMISRTEIKNAQVHGQLSAMRQAVSDGLADPQTAGKKWVTGATDVCPTCSALGMSGAVRLDQSFDGGFDGPTAHPNCRCDVAFVHTLSSAPTAHGAAGPNSPYRPGTDKNPIVWQFPSGFQTKPSYTRAFRPPGFVPPVPPPAAVAVPAKPQAAPPEPMPVNNPVPKARDYDPDGSIEQFPASVSGRELARSKDVKSWPDASTYDEWRGQIPKRVENAKIGGDPAGLNLGPRPGLYESIEQTREIGMPIEVLVRADGTLDILSGGHRLAIADELDLPVRIRWFGKGYDDLADALKVHPVDGSPMAGSMSIKEWKALTAEFKQTGGSYEHLLAKPPARVGAPAKPGVPASNAEIVWDDAGRKWAQLTDDEQLFLLEGHADEIVAQAYDDITGALIAEANPVATRPPLSPDASDEMKAIGRQIDRIDELKAQQAESKIVGREIIYDRDTGEFRGWSGRFDEEIYEWAEMPEGYVPRYEGLHPGSGAKGKRKAVIAVDEAGGVPLPGSTRSLNYIRPDGWDIANPDAPLTHTFIDGAYRRLTQQRFPTRADLPSSVLRELEQEVTKLGAMAREEAMRRGGMDVTEGFVGPAKSWVNTSELKSGKVTDGLNANRVITRQIVDTRDRLSLERAEFLREAGDRLPGVTGLNHLPADELLGGRLPTARHLRSGNAAGEPLHEIDRVLARAIHEPYQQAVEEFVEETLERIGFTQFDPDGSTRIVAQVRNGFTSAGKAADPAYVATEQIAEAVGVMVRQGTLSVDEALTMLNPHGARGTLSGRLGSHLVGTATKRHDEALAIIHEALDSAGTFIKVPGGGEYVATQVVDDLIKQVDNFWGGGKWAGPRGATGQELAGLAISESRLPLWEEFAKLTQAIGRGSADEVANTLLGRLSGITVEAEDDIRLVINKVMKEFRAFGDETFDIGLGISNGSGEVSLAVLDDAAKQAVARMEEAVDDWMPTDWIVRSNQRGELGIAKGGEYGSRASYGDAAHYSLQHQGAYMRTGNGIISIGDDVPGQSTMLHEVTHRAQRASPLHQDLERAWVERRVLDTADSQAQRLRPMKELRPGSNYDSYEKAIEDEFLNPYIGKLYESADDGYVRITQRGRNKWIEGTPINGQFSESSTMAMEHLAAMPGRVHGRLLDDADMVDWWIGMLLGV